MPVKNGLAPQHWWCVSKKFSAYSLVAEISKYLKNLIANPKCKLAVAAKSAMCGKKKLADFRSMNNLADLAILAA